MDVHRNTIKKYEAFKWKCVVLFFRNKKINSPLKNVSGNEGLILILSNVRNVSSILL